MRIGFFVNTYLPITYGSVTSVENFRKAFGNLGHEVFVFAPKFRGYKQKNKNVIEYPAVLYGHKIKYPLPVSWFPPIHKKAKKLRLDIIHVHQPFSIGCDGVRIAKNNNIPLIFTHHARYEDYAHYVPSILPSRLIKKYIRTKVRKFANQCNCVVAPSKSIKKYIEKMDVTSRIKVIPTGIDWKHFQSGKREFVRRKIGINNNEKIILNLGRIEKEKNILFLIHSLFPLLQEDRSLFFVFVGGGSLIPVIKKIAQKMKVNNRVIFVGVVSQLKVRDYYIAADVFVHASQTETQGMTIIEAMASGLPVVAVEDMGISDQIKNGKTGFLTKTNKKDFRKKVKMIMSDHDRRKQIIISARQAAKKMDYMIQARKLEIVYKEEIKKRQLAIRR